MPNLGWRNSSASPKPYFRRGQTSAGFVRCRSLHVRLSKVLPLRGNEPAPIQLQIISKICHTFYFDTPLTILLDKLLMLSILCVITDYETQQRHVSTESMQEFCCTLSVEGCWLG